MRVARVADERASSDLSQEEGRRVTGRQSGRGSLRQSSQVGIMLQKPRVCGAKGQEEGGSRQEVYHSRFQVLPSTKLPP
jgi:hypothetical protein